MSSKSIFLISFFIFLLLVGLISHKRNVNYLTHSLRVPLNCKAPTESNVTCENYQIYWYYSDKKSQAAFIRQFTNRVLSNKKYVLADTLQFDSSSQKLSTLIFESNSKIVTTISFGALQNKYVVVVFESKVPLQSIEQFPEFVKNLLSLS